MATANSDETQKPIPANTVSGRCDGGEAVGIVLLLMGILAWAWYGKSDEKKPVADRTTIENRTISYLTEIDKLMSEPLSDMTSASRLTNDYERVADRIDRLRTDGVSQQARLHGVDVSGLLRDYAVLCQRAGSLLQRTKQAKAHYGSDQAFAEFFVRAANGDPFGKIKESFQVEHQFQREFQLLSEEELRLSARRSDLATARQRLRALAR